MSARPGRRALADLALALVAAGLVLGGLTLLTLSREEAIDAGTGRTGTASVQECDRYGPVSGSGLGYWWRCDVTVQWADGGTGRYREGGSLFTPDEAGRRIAVRELLRGSGRGNLDAAPRLLRPDRPAAIGALVAGLGLFLAGGICGLRPIVDLVRGTARLIRHR